MVKNVFILIFCSLLLQKADAQAVKDTLVSYLTSRGKLVQTKDSADFVMFNLPADTTTKLFKVVILYKKGTPKLIASSKTRNWPFFMQGICTSYYPNGHKRSIAIYKNGKLAGDAIEYYASGKLYTSLSYRKEIDSVGGLFFFRNGEVRVDSAFELQKNSIAFNKLALTECRDSTGKVLAENGNGLWITFDEQLKTVIAQGPISNGKKDGEWMGLVADTGKYVCLFKNGEPVSGVGYDRAGNAHQFTKLKTDATYPGGIKEFLDLIRRVAHYPRDGSGRVSGKVFVSFVISNDGRVVDARVVRSVSKYLGDQALEAVKLSKRWIPATEYGMPVNMEFTVPVNFTSN